MKQKNILGVLLILLLVSGCHTVERLPSGKWMDLSHNFDDKTIYWPTAELFDKKTVFEGITKKGFYYTAYRFCAAEHQEYISHCSDLLCRLDRS